MNKKVKTPIANSQKLIAIFGGTFNPIHYGHLKMAETALRQFNLDLIYFIPCGNPPHKDKSELLDGKLRLRLLKKAIAENKKFKALDLEIKKTRKSYTIHTVKNLLKIHKPKDADLYFLVGIDAFESLKSWYKVEDLVKLVTFIVLPRQKAKGKKLKAPRIKGLKYELLKAKPINISSKEIRERAAKGKSTSKLSPINF